MEILPGIQKVAGTSAGAITACLVSLDYSAEAIRDAVFALDFKKFEDGWDPLRLVSRYGLYQGDSFLAWIKTMITAKAHAGENATFKDFHEQGLRDLYVYATDLNLFTYKQFSYKDTPDTIVAEAVRASMSIPLFFKAWRFTGNIPDDHVYVDGGVLLNYPMNALDDVTTVNDPQTLGLYLYDFNGLKKPGALGYDQPAQYCKVLFETLLSSQDIDFSTDKCVEQRTIRIDDYGILANDFSITDEQKNSLYESGKSAASEFLESHPFLG